MKFETRNLLLRVRRRLARLKIRGNALIRILISDYPNIWRDIDLEEKLWSQERPFAQKIREDTNWQYFEIEDLRLIWPTQLASHELNSLYHEIFASFDHNPHAYEYKSVKICQGDWVVDAGACEGFFTYYALKRGANVLIIEPVPLLVEALTHTFQDQIKTGRVKILAGGLGAEAATLRLATDNTRIYASAISDTGEAPVSIYTLNDILAEQLIPTVDFLKMDIEDNEVNAIKGSLEVIQKYKPKLSLAVYHHVDNAKIIRKAVMDRVPAYQIKYRGVWMRNGDSPRPYMLYGIPS